MLTISKEDPASADSVALMTELSAVLEAITGPSGAASFDVNDMRASGACFAHLEKQAAALGYAALCQETRLINLRAVAFYEARKYQRTPNYGRYAGNALAACFSKQLS